MIQSNFTDYKMYKQITHVPYSNADLFCCDVSQSDRNCCFLHCSVVCNIHLQLDAISITTRHMGVVFFSILIYAFLF